MFGTEATDIFVLKYFPHGCGIRYGLCYLPARPAHTSLCISLKRENVFDLMLMRVKTADIITFKQAQK